MSKIKPHPPQSESSRGRGTLACVGRAALSKEDAKRVTELVAPKPGLHDDCVREAAISVQWIMHKTATPSAGKRKAALRNVANKIEETITILTNLPEDMQHEFDPEPLQHHLKQMLALAEALAKKIKVTPSGGKSLGRIDAAKKRAAADCAFVILRTYGSRLPTLYRIGPYVLLASLLFELATGKPFGDVERACKERLRAKMISARAFEMYELRLAALQYLK